MSNYWVVGASFESGTKDMYDEFILRGYWYLGWDDSSARNKHVKEFLDRTNKMRVNDRIAIKQLLGQGQNEILIRAIGIISDVQLDQNTVYVKWLLTNIDRKVPIHGCVGSVYGPYNLTDNWTREVFTI